MNFSVTRRTACWGTSLLLLAGCATNYEGPRSGYLPPEDYTMVHKETAPSGGDRYAYFSGTFNPTNYHALIIDPLQYYPAPEPNQFVTGDTLVQIQIYADESLRRKIGAKVRLVNTPGPGVARWSTALTAVGAEKQSLKPYQYIPVALVVTGAKAAAQGGLPIDSDIAFESQIVDSVTKDVLAIDIRGGTGATVQYSEEKQQGHVTLDDVKKLIDTWTDSAAEQVTKYVSPK